MDQVSALLDASVDLDLVRDAAFLSRNSRLETHNSSMIAAKPSRCRVRAAGDSAERTAKSNLVKRAGQKDKELKSAAKNKKKCES